MIKLTLELDFETWEEFWMSYHGDKIEKVILSSKCISWRGEGGEE